MEKKKKKKEDGEKRECNLNNPKSEHDPNIKQTTLFNFLKFSKRTHTSPLIYIHHQQNLRTFLSTQKNSAKFKHTLLCILHNYHFSLSLPFKLKFWAVLPNPEKFCKNQTHAFSNLQIEKDNYQISLSLSLRNQSSGQFHQSRNFFAKNQTHPFLNLRNRRRYLSNLYLTPFEIKVPGSFPLRFLACPPGVWVGKIISERQLINSPPLPPEEFIKRS